ncbi:flagellar basal body P-ring protein FlgI [Flagellatimonas centrodinii]|uniref:flagellar basal body P-ring protein FlgI n=1 Tax=Flagellatimonas centrodinii TaxID=2806210 RepID=UPI001FFCEB0D|nr:flagellar basal body P-ring protein FlgI [Flagellatimonas centrodinii]ULQ45698.1 flagellar basal body P-ring protein FlgI [Flagellatimonas centrodinii]
MNDTRHSGTEGGTTASSPCLLRLVVSNGARVPSTVTRMPPPPHSPSEQVPLPATVRLRSPPLPVARAFFIAALVLLALLSLAQTAHAERIKDIASLAGVRSNALMGYGLVVGLDGSGDQTSQAPFTTQALRNLLTQLGVTIPTSVNPQLKNAAAVMVQAELPPFSRPGQLIDVTVASVGNAGSLRGGALLMTALKGADGQVYAIAQGNLVVGGFGVEGSDGSRVSLNVPSAGRIPNGASVERPAPAAFDPSGRLALQLHTADFTTAARVAETVNAVYGEGTAQAEDGVTIHIRAPHPAQRVAFLSELEVLEVDPGRAPARVVVNSRTGTIVIGESVRVRPAAVAHGSLSVTIAEQFQISQPAPFSDGETVVVPDSRIAVEQQGDGRMFLFDAGVTLAEIVQAVNQVGAAPGDLIAILEALKQAGALRAELVVI